MIIHLYTLCWNEEKILPFFLRHYTPLVDRIFVADDGSTDRSAEMLSKCPLVTFRKFDGAGDSFIFAQQKDSDGAWKQSRGVADWVICCDMDEFLYHENFRAYLEESAAKGITILPSRGFQMVAEDFPPEDWDLPREIVRGMPFHEMSKTIIFNPAAIEETRFSPGKHVVFPTGRPVFPKTTELKLLHYKYLGREYLVRRHADLFTRRRRIDLERRFGFQYSRTAQENILEFERVKRLSMQVVPRKSDAPINKGQAALDRVIEELSTTLENTRAGATRQWYLQTRKCDRLEATVQSEQVETKRLTALLKDTQADNERQSQQLEALIAEANRQEARLQEIADNRERQSRQISGLMEEIERLTTSARLAFEREKRAASRMAKLEQEREKLRHQRQALRDKNAALSKYREHYRAIRWSFYWKLTSPLRKFGRLFGRKVMF
jgi:Glycosyl transferase family 2